MQWIAMVTMLIDHIGVVFFPEQVTFRVIGRIAFPIYVYLAVLGYRRTSSFSKYFTRLVILALLSQLPFQLAFDTNGINVIGTLAISILIIKCIDALKGKPILYISIALIGAIVLDSLPFDYGAYGLILMLLYRYLMHKPAFLLLAHIALELLFLIVKQWGIQFISLIVTLAFISNEALISKLDSLRAPKWIWRLFYPLHLTILFVIVNFL